MEEVVFQPPLSFDKNRLFRLKRARRGSFGEILGRRPNQSSSILRLIRRKHAPDHGLARASDG